MSPIYPFSNLIQTFRHKSTKTRVNCVSIRKQLKGTSVLQSQHWWLYWFLHRFLFNFCLFYFFRIGLVKFPLCKNVISPCNFTLFYIPCRIYILAKQTTCSYYTQSIYLNWQNKCCQANFANIARQEGEKADLCARGQCRKKEINDE